MPDSVYLRALNSDDPSVRRTAIIQLGKSLDQSALPYLAQVYRTDPDPAIRELARKAGLHIRQHQPEEAPADATPTGAVARSNHRYYTFVMIFAGALLLLGFFTPWLAGGISVTGQADTYSGYAIATNAEGIAEVLSGIEGVFGGGAVTFGGRTVTSFSPYLVLFAGAVQVVLGAFVLILPFSGSWYWTQGIALAFAGFAGIGWFYAVITDIPFISIGDLAGIGFWISTIGGAMLVLGAASGLIFVGKGENR